MKIIVVLLVSFVLVGCSTQQIKKDTRGFLLNIAHGVNDVQNSLKETRTMLQSLKISDNSTSNPTKKLGVKSISSRKCTPIFDDIVILDRNGNKACSEDETSSSLGPSLDEENLKAFSKELKENFMESMNTGRDFEPSMELRNRAKIIDMEIIKFMIENEKKKEQEK